MRASRLEYDAAYGFFLFTGIAVLIVEGLSAMPMDTGTAGGIGLLLAVPLCASSLLAMVTGVVWTFRLRDDHGLLALSSMALLFIADFLAEFLPSCSATPEPSSTALGS